MKETSILAALHKVMNLFPLSMLISAPCLLYTSYQENKFIINDMVAKLQLYSYYIATVVYQSDKSLRETYAPVSYTHLDVYKRQLWYSPTKIGTS